ncbi:hypothetical protein [uncultured Cohaesibacter sp.]|uniref:hypothetical protein n=1 Tax=uncultured Cohaesibacter sp. TaxID=1002546 RepID=UPI0029C84990|nr:hypothetical protein [uncultured Cohaesibacter sp.]
MRKVFILGDSHAYQIELAHRETDKLDDKALGLELEFRTFGAVRQGIRPHHRVVGSRIELLEDNWQEKILPLENDPMDGTAIYVLSLPFNITPMLRSIEFSSLTNNPEECLHHPKQQGWVEQLIERHVAPILRKIHVLPKRKKQEDKGRQFISKGLMSQLIERRSGLGVALARDMKKIGMTVIVVASPRPFSHVPFAPDNPGLFCDLVDQFVTETTDALEASGIPVLQQPEGTLDTKQQLTRAELDRGDEQHASLVYYSETLKELLDLCARQPKSAEDCPRGRIDFATQSPGRDDSPKARSPDGLEILL